MDDLPVEMVDKILSYSDQFDIVTQKFVCRLWKNLIPKCRVPDNYVTETYKRSPKLLVWVRTKGGPVFDLVIWCKIFTYIIGDPYSMVHLGFVCKEWRCRMYLNPPSDYLRRLCQLKRFRIARWALNLGAREKENICSYLTILGDFSLLKRAHRNGCKLDKFVCENAAIIDRLDILQWALHRGCMLNENTFINAGPKCQAWLRKKGLWILVRPC